MGGRSAEESGAGPDHDRILDDQRESRTMNLPHLRPDHVNSGVYDGQVPAGQARALHRRRTLEAQQRAFRDGERANPTASAADLAPIRRRTWAEGPAR
jgi:hypothetical protein